MEHLLRLGIVILLILLGLVANLVVMTGLWPLRQIQSSALPVPRFSRAPPPVLDRLLGAATVAAFLLAVLTGVSQLPVLAFGKLFVVWRHGHNSLYRTEVGELGQNKNLDALCAARVSAYYCNDSSS
jgi:hypothetical protein